MAPAGPLSERAGSSLPEELARIVGSENVSADAAALDRAALTTLPYGTRPSIIVRPSERGEVREVVRRAGAAGVPVYPISTGRNWGYGDACAPVGGCVLLDLSRMDRIVEVNVPLAYAVVEPGVTQGQLARHLEEAGLPLVLDATGAGPDASIIGNIAERGFGHTAYGDRFAHALCFEAVLADGSVVTTGFGSYEGARAAHVYKWGIGPVLDGLLTQSSLAVITRMTVWLMPKPEKFLAYFILLEDPGAIGGLVERLRPLRLDGTLRTAIHCFSGLRLVANAFRFPWERSNGRVALELSHPDWLERACRERRIPAWGASGSLSGTAAQVRAHRRLLKEALAGLPGLDRIVFVDDRRLRFAEGVAAGLTRLGTFNTLRSLVSNLRLGFDLLAGKTSHATLRGGQWRARKDGGPTEDLIASGSGLIWVVPVIPMTGEAVDELIGVAEPIFHAFGFECPMALSLVNERAICATLSIHFDRGNAEECRRARECETSLVEALIAAGFIPYRGTPSTQAAIRAAAPEYWNAVERLKGAWDPDGILAPGRYSRRNRS